MPELQRHVTEAFRRRVKEPPRCRAFQAVYQCMKTGVMSMSRVMNPSEVTAN